MLFLVFTKVIKIGLGAFWLSLGKSSVAVPADLIGSVLAAESHPRLRCPLSPSLPEHLSCSPRSAGLLVVGFTLCSTPAHQSVLTPAYWCFPSASPLQPWSRGFLLLGPSACLSLIPQTCFPVSSQGSPPAPAPPALRPAGSHTPSKPHFLVCRTLLTSKTQSHDGGKLWGQEQSSWPVVITHSASVPPFPHGISWSFSLLFLLLSWFLSCSLISRLFPEFHTLLLFLAVPLSLEILGCHRSASHCSQLTSLSSLVISVSRLLDEDAWISPQHSHPLLFSITAFPITQAQNLRVFTHPLQHPSYSTQPNPLLSSPSCHVPLVKIKTFLSTDNCHSLLTASSPPQPHLLFCTYCRGISQYSVTSLFRNLRCPRCLQQHCQ